MKKIWSGEVVEHDSDFISWHGFKSYPVPVQKPHLPVIIGGSKGKIFERIAKHGDGWFAPTGGDELKTSLESLRTACAAEGRDFTEIEITTMWPGQGGDEAVQALADMGVGRLVIPTMALGADPVEGIQKLAEEVIG